MIRFASLSSGSSGNSYLIGYGDKNILIDAGISNKRIRDGLESLGIDAESLSAIFVTEQVLITYTSAISSNPTMVKPSFLRISSMASVSYALTLQPRLCKAAFFIYK